jgi:cell division protein YceG involved in septum cleavage
MAVSNDKEIVIITIKNTNINTVTKELYEKNLIKSKNVFKIYLDIFKISKFKKGIFKLSKSMNVEQIVDTLTKKEE